MLKICDIQKFPKKKLLRIIELAINKIDILENVTLPGYDSDERDWKDMSCDFQFILADVVEQMEQSEIDGLTKNYEPVGFGCAGGDK